MNYCCGDKFEIRGGHRLVGTFQNQTSKNAVLPIMSASIMCAGKVKILDVPDILDVENMKKILKGLGVLVRKQKENLILDSSGELNSRVDENLSKTMRSSIFLLGALLARNKHARIALPGGCKIGKRPINLHIKAFKKLHVKVKIRGERLIFDATKSKPNKIKLKIPSVGASENIIQFASLLKGKTTIINPAREPEVVDLCHFLNRMGARILGAGTNKITIYGVDKLAKTQYQPIKDRIVSGTIMIAAAATRGDVTILDGCVNENLSLIKILRSMGCQIELNCDTIHITANQNLKKFDVATGYYPDFPTDLQSIIIPLLIFLQGECKIKEKVFENRFLVVPELNKMGANIALLDAHTACVKNAKLHASKVETTDLRGGAALVIAALCTKGKTEISNIQLIDRGYDHLEKMLSSLGVSIKRVES